MSNLLRKFWSIRHLFIFIFFLLYIIFYRIVLFQTQFLPENFSYIVRVFTSGILFDASFLLLILFLFSLIRNRFSSQWKLIPYTLGILFFIFNMINFSLCHFYKAGLVNFSYLAGYLNEVFVLLISGKKLVSGWYLFILCFLPIILFLFSSHWWYSANHLIQNIQIHRERRRYFHFLKSLFKAQYASFRLISLSVLFYWAAYLLVHSPHNILSSNIVYRMLSNELKTVSERFRYTFFLQGDEKKNKVYPDRKYFQEQGYRFLLKGYPLVKEPVKKKLIPKIKPNLVFIILESLAAKDTGLQKYISTSGTNVTPFLNSLIPQSVVVAPFFANADYTAGAETAIFCSTHDSLRYSIAHGSILRDFTNTRLLCLPKILADMGYVTSFFHSYTSTFDNKHLFFPLNGVQEVIDRDDQSFKGLKRVSFGFISDEELFLYGVKYLSKVKKPFFASFLTVNNHAPFIMHDSSKKKIIVRQKKYNDYLNTVRQTDDALRSFFQKASREDWYENTIFMITSDNGVLVSEKGIKDMRWEYFFKIWHIVPFLLYNPSKKFGLEQRLIRLKSASHIDIVPSILDLLDVKITNPFAGESLFKRKRKEYTLIYDWFNNYYRLSWPYLYHNTDHQMHDLVREKKVLSSDLGKYRKWVKQSCDFFNSLIYQNQLWPAKF